MANTLQYVTDGKGHKTAVVIPIADYERLLEDLDDLAVAAERRGEASVPHDKFKEELKRDGLLSD